MNKNDLGCSFGCLEGEDQHHIFAKCEQIQNNKKKEETVCISNIYWDIQQQIQAEKIFVFRESKIFFLWFRINTIMIKTRPKVQTMT